jgi:cellulose synthase/poly-beta-1,6-N-acetylglucosamine synthase-like glycosyltransferase
MASGDLDPQRYGAALAQATGFGVHDGRKGRVAITGDEAEAWQVLRGARPIRLLPERAVGIPLEAVSPQSLARLADALGPSRRRVRLLTRAALIRILARNIGAAILRRATSRFSQERPDLSARSGLWLWQSAALAAVIGAAAGALGVAPRETLTVISLFLSLLFVLAIALRLVASISRSSNDGGALALRSPTDAELPVYTVLVPLFREEAILPHLAEGLAKLDYPPAKLDIKIIMESVDAGTIAAAARAGFGGNVDFIIVPDGQPRTKPKALNYALEFATGELVVVFDAEDRPEPDQLRKAAAIFANAPPELVCLQARLDYYNARQNWLTRQFTIEYASLFRGLLPFFSKERLPLPLGGTSNHFRMSVLRDLGGWDPYNVTEDADLGVRLCREGMRAEMLDSTTYEEAACETGIWLRQRTRWLKGWMQTYGVHMRSPLALYRGLGARGFLVFQAYFAGIILSALCHPVFYAILCYDTLGGTIGSADGAPGLLYVLGAVNMICGYAAAGLIGWTGLRRAGKLNLAPHLAFIPLYWIFISAAAYRAVWQLIRSPFYWEKTPHGMSKGHGGE